MLAPSPLSRAHQTTLPECSRGKSVSEASTAQLTNAIMALSSSPQANPSYRPPWRGTNIMRLQETGKAMNATQSARATFIGHQQLTELLTDELNYYYTNNCTICSLIFLILY